MSDIDVSVTLIRARLEKIVSIIDVVGEVRIKLVTDDNGVPVLMINEEGFMCPIEWRSDPRASIAAWVYAELDRLGRLDLHETFAAQWYGRRDDDD